MTDSICVWTYDEDDGGWFTDCGEGFETTTGTPSENKFKYCPFCGEVLVEFAAGNVFIPDPSQMDY